MIAKVESLHEDLKVAVDKGWFPKDAFERLAHSNPSKQAVPDDTKLRLQQRIIDYYAKDYKVFGYATNAAVVQ